MFRLLKPIHDDPDTPPLTARQFKVAINGTVSELPPVRMPISNINTVYYQVLRKQGGTKYDPPHPGMKLTPGAMRNGNSPPNGAWNH